MPPCTNRKEKIQIQNVGYTVHICNKISPRDHGTDYTRIFIKGNPYLFAGCVGQRSFTIYDNSVVSHCIGEWW